MGESGPVIYEDAIEEIDEEKPTEEEIEKKQEYAEKIIANLIVLLTSWDNEILANPAPDLGEDNKYKVRNNWFAAVLAEIDISIDPYKILPESAAEIFMKIQEEESTREKQIEKTDMLIIDVIGYLGEKWGAKYEYEYQGVKYAGV